MGSVSAVSSVHRAWLTGGFHTELGGSVIDAEFPVKTFVIEIIKLFDVIAPGYSIVPGTPELPTISNARGRPIAGFGEHESKEEIFYLVGTIADRDEASADTAEEPELLDFSCSLLSEFSEMTSPSEMLHKVSLQASKAFVQRDYSIDTALCDSDVSIDKFHLTLERYRPRHFGSMIGLAPRIESWCEITLDAKALKFLFVDASSQNEHGFPLGCCDIIDLLAQLLAQHNIFAKFKTALMSSFVKNPTKIVVKKPA